MKKKIPFDIKYRPQIESGKVQVVTRDDRPVRIICWDVKDRYSIAAFVKFVDAEDEIVSVYTQDGFYQLSKKPCQNDLFLLVDDGLTDFQSLLAECIMEVQRNVVDPLVHAEVWSDTLMEEARKELAADKDNPIYQAGVEAGKAEALKDLDEKEGVFASIVKDAYNTGVRAGKIEALKEVEK